MNAPENKKIAELSAKIKSFPALPAIVNHILKITADPKSTVEELIDAIRPDLALNTAILKISNSAFFGQMRQVSSLKQALLVIGFSEVQNIVLSKAVFNHFKKIRSNSPFKIHAFWEHSFLCGLAAKVIATELALDTNEFFVAGLIHDVGKLVVLMTMPDDFQSIVAMSQPDPLDTIQAEKSVIGTTHDKIGMGLLTRWMFPACLIKATGFHHQPEKAVENQMFPVIIHIANSLAHMIQGPGREIDESRMEDCLPRIVRAGERIQLDLDKQKILLYLEELVSRMEEEKAILDLFLA